MINRRDIINFFKPSFHRIVLTLLALSVYHNTYSHTNNKLNGAILGPVIFPSFYLAYMYIYYPENFNYINKNPTVPDTGLFNEINKFINSPSKTIILFTILYLFFTFFLYKKKFKNLPIINKFKDYK